MKPEEWRRGMENEAENVEDAGWADDARRAARRTGFRHFLLSMLAALLALGGLALGLVAYNAAASLGFLSAPGGLLNGLATSLLALGIAYLLGRAQFSPLGVAVASALFPALTWMVTSLITVPTGSLTDALPTWPLLQESGLSELFKLLARAGVGYMGTRWGLQAARHWASTHKQEAKL